MDTSQPGSERAKQGSNIKKEKHSRSQPQVDAHTEKSAHRKITDMAGDDTSLRKSQNMQWWLQEIKKEVDRTPVDLITRLLPGTRVEWKRNQMSGIVQAAEKEQITVVLRTSDGKVRKVTTNQKNLKVIHDRIDVGEGVRLCLSTLAKMRRDTS
jgi:hypothetical protein